MKVIQARLGHGSIRVTMDVYGHLVEGLDQDAATKIGNYLDGEAAMA
jgi:integrase